MTNEFPNFASPLGAIQIKDWTLSSFQSFRDGGQTGRGFDMFDEEEQEPDIEMPPLMQLHQLDVDMEEQTATPPTTQTQPPPAEQIPVQYDFSFTNSAQQQPPEPPEPPERPERPERPEPPENTEPPKNTEPTQSSIQKTAVRKAAITSKPGAGTGAGPAADSFMQSTVTEFETLSLEEQMQLTRSLYEKQLVELKIKQLNAQLKRLHELKRKHNEVIDSTMQNSNLVSVPSVTVRALPESGPGPIPAAAASATQSLSTYQETVATAQIEKPEVRYAVIKEIPVGSARPSTTHMYQALATDLFRNGEALSPLDAKLRALRMLKFCYLTHQSLRPKRRTVQWRKRRVHDSLAVQHQRQAKLTQTTLMKKLGNVSGMPGWESGLPKEKDME